MIDRDPNDWTIPIGPDYATDEPEFMVAYGRSMAEWGSVEHSLGKVFATAIATPHHLRALAALHAIIGFRDRLNVVNAVMLDLFRSYPDRMEPIKLEWARLQDRISAVQKKRNSLAHMHVWHSPGLGTFGGKDITKTMYLPINEKERRKAVVTIGMMVDYRKSFRVVADRLNALNSDLHASLNGSTGDSN